MTKYLFDSSVLIALSRGKSPQLHKRVRAAITSGAQFLLCEPVAMEYIAGFPIARIAEQNRYLNSFALLSLDPHRDFRAAGSMFATLRDKGVTVRGTMDCLIAVIAMAAEDVTLIHDDRDFELMSRHVPLRQERWSAAG